MNPPSRTAGGRCPLLLYGALLLSLAVAPARAQDPGNEVTYTRQPVFRIPFQTQAGERRVKQVQLYVSNDQGKSWHPSANVRPDEGSFNFTANRDGLYWFTVRTIDFDNRAYPLSLENAPPGLKVVVDTLKPVINLRPLAPADNQAGVEWEVQDENLDPSSLALEYRRQGSGEWLPIRIEQPGPGGKQSWSPSTNGTLEVRLSARDRAGNEGSGQTVVAEPRVTGEPTARTNPPNPAPASTPEVRMVNSKRISLNYEVKEVGPSGVSVVELWYTQDGRSWQKYSEDPTHRPPYVVDVNGEGLYGFSLVVRSGVGLGDRPPQVGEPPQVWVEVDLTKPVVRVLNVDVGRGQDSGNLTVTWSAIDKNLGKQPITLSYAEQASGPWTALAANVENTGRYVWHMPQGVPFRFMLRVEAADKAGNVGSAETGKSVIVDLAQPKGVILNVEPGK